eukprot:964892-Prorocentrum_minimum.AAC.1
MLSDRTPPFRIDSAPHPRKALETSFGFECFSADSGSRKLSQKSGRGLAAPPSRTSKAEVASDSGGFPFDNRFDVVMSVAPALYAPAPPPLVD